MPKVTLHPAIRTNRKTGTTTMSKVPDMTKVKWSKAQKAHRRRFKEAVAYAKLVKTQPEVGRCIRKSQRRSASGRGTWRFRIITMGPVWWHKSNLQPHTHDVR